MPHTSFRACPGIVKSFKWPLCPQQHQGEIPEGSLACWHLVSTQQKCRTKSSLAKETRLCFYVLRKKEITVVILQKHSRLIKIHYASGRYRSRNNWIQLDLQMLTASLTRPAIEDWNQPLEWKAERNLRILFRSPFLYFPSFFHQRENLFKNQIENN